MKIIQFISENTLTGGPRHVSDLVDGLKKRGHEVVVIKLKSTDRRGQIEELREKLIDIRKGSLRSPAMAGSVGMTDRREDNAAGVIFHCHGVRGGLIGRLAAKGLEIPVVYTEHLWTKDFYLKNILRQKLQLAMLKKLDKYTTRTIAVSNAVRDFLIENKITPASKISVVCNGVNIPPRNSKSKNLVIPAKAGILDSHLHGNDNGEQIQNLKFVVGSLGADNYIKNFKTLEKAFAIVKKEFPNAELKIEHNEKDLKNFYNSISVYVQSSLSESFGIAAAEAMSYGVPVVASGVGGLKELIENNKSGILIKPDDVDAFAKAIIKLSKNNNLRRAIGEGGRERIIKNFSLEKMINETEKVYEQVF